MRGRVCVDNAPTAADAPVADKASPLANQAPSPSDNGPVAPADLMLAFEQMKKAFMADQIQDLQRQWNNTCDKFKQENYVPAPLQPMPPLAPPGPAVFMQLHQGFGCTRVSVITPTHPFRGPAPWP
jgi:hypothetical protein